jgi:MarR family transcriptional regulator, temperature-dependent positive regulator of motility
VYNICSKDEQMDEINTKHRILDSEKVLDLLREVQANPQVTQRYLAEKHDISLGKINFLIKMLVEKGIINAKSFKNSNNKIAYLYMLSPEGVKLRFKLTRKFFARKTEEYKRFKLECELLDAKLDSGESGA